MSDDLETPDTDEMTSERMLRTHSFLGKQLREPSYYDEVALQKLGFDGASELESTVHLVWICTQSPSRIAQINGFASVQDARKEAAEWAIANKIRLRSKNGKECARIAYAMWADMRDSEMEPDLPSSPNAAGRAERPTTSPESAK